MQREGTCSPEKESFAGTESLMRSAVAQRAEFSRLLLLLCSGKSGEGPVAEVQLLPTAAGSAAAVETLAEPTGVFISWPVPIVDSTDAF